MPFIKQLNKDFVIKDNHFELSPSMMKDSWKFKKITGTRLSAVIGANKYTSPLKVWCCMVGIYSEPIDPTIAKLGMYVEPKVRDYVSQKLNIKFKDYVPAEVKWNVFDGKTPTGYEMLGGIPDGEPINDLGEVDYSTGNPMLEVKTSSIDAFVGRGGSACTQPGGITKIDQKMFDDTVAAVGGSEHPAKLGVMLAARELGWANSYKLAVYCNRIITKIINVMSEREIEFKYTDLQQSFKDEVNNKEDLENSNINEKNIIVHKNDTE